MTIFIRSGDVWTRPTFHLLTTQSHNTRLCDFNTNFFLFVWLLWNVKFVGNKTFDDTKHVDDLFSRQIDIFSKISLYFILIDSRLNALFVR
jgi:hypothetical protein